MSDFGYYALDGLLDFFLNLIRNPADYLVGLPRGVFGERLHAGSTDNWMKEAGQKRAFLPGVRLKRWAVYSRIPGSGHPHSGIDGILDLPVVIMNEILIGPVSWSKRHRVGEREVTVSDDCENCSNDADSVARAIEKESGYAGEGEHGDGVRVCSPGEEE